MARNKQKTTHTILGFRLKKVVTGIHIKIVSEFSNLNFSISISIEMFGDVKTVSLAFHKHP